MPDLDIQKTGFDGCYDALKRLSSELRTKSFSLDLAGDTSPMGVKEKECCDKLLTMIGDLAALADETAADVKLTKARYVLADN